MFVAGSFYGCITLVQSVAEGLGKFLAEKNTIKVYNNHDKLIAELSNRGVISATAREAFKAIRGKDRNDFHHLNKRIPQDRDKLEKRAEGCMNSLYTIESEVFAYEHDGTGRIIMKHRKYWPPDDDRGMVRVWRRRTP